MLFVNLKTLNTFYTAIFGNFEINVIDRNQYHEVTFVTAQLIRKYNTGHYKYRVIHDVQQEGEKKH